MVETSNLEAFAKYWLHATGVKEAFGVLGTLQDQNFDAVICASKAMVECACKTIVKELDDPGNPIKGWKDTPFPPKKAPSLGQWVSATTRLLRLTESNDDPMNQLIGQYNQLAVRLGEMRNQYGTVSHGRSGFHAKLTSHHRNMCIMHADTIVGLLHDAYISGVTNPTYTFEPYDRFAHLNVCIDSSCYFEEAIVEDSNVIVGQITTADNQTVIPFSLRVSELLFATDKEGYKQAALIAPGFHELSKIENGGLNE